VDETSAERLEAFMRLHYARMVHVVTFVGSAAESAEDLVQEAVARAWERLAKGEAIESIEAWVLTVALNLARSRLRKLRRPSHWLAGSDVATSPLEVVAGNLDVWRAIRALHRTQREVAALYYLTDFDIHSIASMREMSESAVKNALFKARQGLARALNPDLVGDWNA
jgi:RNA polymerase sigma-70 factor (ECF subfamily)